MERSSARSVIAIATAVLFLAQNAIALADRGSELQFQIDQLNSQMNWTRSQLGANRAEQNALLAQMAELDQKIISTTAEIDRLTSDLNEKRAQRQETERQIEALVLEIQKTISELNAAKERLDRQRKILSGRLKGIYKYGKKTYLQVVFESSSFDDFLNRLSFLAFIAAQDARILNGIKRTKALIEAKEAQLERDKASLDAKKLALMEQERSIEQLKSEQEAKRSSLQNELAQRQALMAKLQQDEAAMVAAMQQEEADAARLASELRAWNAQQAERAARASSRGEERAGAKSSSGWVWPVGTMADITSGFGWRSAPTAGASSFHEGVDIGVDYGTPVVAANSGTVTVAEYWGGFGLFIVIDHGGGISSSYAHLSGFAVSVGQYVSAGQVIGYVGSTGVSTGPHLDFRIYVDGVAQNPLNWY